METIAFWVWEDLLDGTPLALLREYVDDRGVMHRQTKAREHPWQDKQGVDHYGIGGDSVWETCSPENAVEVLLKWGVEPDPFEGIENHGISQRADPAGDQQDPA